MSYSEIIERLEKATGPSYELERMIHDAAGPNGPTWNACGNPAYTASLDAAIVLVERMLPGWSKGVDIGPKTKLAFVDRHDHGNRIFGARFVAEGVSPSIAILLAMFRALEAEAKP